MCQANLIGHPEKITGFGFSRRDLFGATFQAVANYKIFSLFFEKT